MHNSKAFFLEERLFLSSLSKTQDFQWDMRERHEQWSSVYEGKWAGVSSQMALEVIAWTTGTVVGKWVNACESSFVLSASDH